MIACRDEAVLTRLRTAKRLWWFLDYDGTLADFAPNPDVILPDPELIELVARLAAQDNMRLTIVSGRRLAHIEQLLPIAGIIKAGSYGLELRLATGELEHPIAQSDVRPSLDVLKEQWKALLAGHSGFYLEDKGWTLAIHAKDARDPARGKVMALARQLADRIIPANSPSILQVAGGHHFLEVAPRMVSKQQTVRTILKEYSWPEALPIYLGDDDKDASAFGVIQAGGGIAVAVGNRPATAAADCRLGTPADCRRWLERFLT